MLKTRVIEKFHDAEAKVEGDQTVATTRFGIVQIERDGATVGTIRMAIEIPHEGGEPHVAFSLEPKVKGDPGFSYFTQTELSGAVAVAFLRLAASALRYLEDGDETEITLHIG